MNTFVIVMADSNILKGFSAYVTRIGRGFLSRLAYPNKNIPLLASKIALKSKPAARFLEFFVAPILAITVGSGYCETASAYIPSAKTILTRTAKNGGKGSFLIEQDVIFRSAAETVSLRERWTVVNGDWMRLLVTTSASSAALAAPGSIASPMAARLDIIYQNGRKTYPQPESGKFVTSGYSAEFFEPFSFLKSYRGYADALTRYKILSPGALRDRPLIKSLVNYKVPSEPFVRLARQAGSISWVFGDPTPTSAAGQSANPALWIEQDSFQVRKLRLPVGANSTQAEVGFENISHFSNGLSLARERNLTWGNNSVTIKIVSAKSVSESSASSTAQPGSLKEAEAKAAKLPDVAVVREFYARFR
jgi:hypothetical protein